MDPRTAGRNYGLHWTAAEVDNPEVNQYVEDDGRFVEVLAELGVTVLDSLALREERGEA